MDISDDDLRAIVRESIARHLGGARARRRARSRAPDRRARQLRAAAALARRRRRRRLPDRAGRPLHALRVLPVVRTLSAILVTRTLPSSVISKLETAGAVDLYTGDAAIPVDELKARVADKDALVCLLTDPIDRAVLDAAPKLKIVANVAVGYNNVDVAYARSRGIVVTNTPDVLTESVADFTWAMILAITRRLSEGERLLRRGAWKGWALDFMLGTELRGKQLGLVGMGRIARAVAARAPAFGMRVAYASRTPAAGAGAAGSISRSTGCSTRRTSSRCTCR